MLMLIGGIGSQELILIIIVLLILFGGSKLPALMRGAGKGIKEFKDAMNGEETPVEKEKKDDTTKEEK
ncbi:MAG: twin-arginine translocase TatA/TatE family subunit [Rikenellaceae bacterium]